MRAVLPDSAADVQLTFETQRLRGQRQSVGIPQADVMLEAEDADNIAMRASSRITEGTDMLQNALATKGPHVREAIAVVSLRALTFWGRDCTLGSRTDNVCRDTTTI